MHCFPRLSGSHKEAHLFLKPRNEHYGFKEGVEKYIAFQNNLGTIRKHIYLLSHEMSIMASKNELNNILFSETFWEP